MRSSPLRPPVLTWPVDADKLPDMVERRMATVTYLLKAHATSSLPWTHFVAASVGTTRGG